LDIELVNPNQLGETAGWGRQYRKNIRLFSVNKILFGKTRSSEAMDWIWRHLISRSYLSGVKTRVE